MTIATPASDGVITKLSRHSVDETVSNFMGILNSKGLTVFAVIDQREEAIRVGLRLRKMTLIIFGSPEAGTPVMDSVPLAALDLPLKLLVWDDGGQTKASYVAPSELGARHHLPPNLAKNLAGIDALTDALIRST